MGEVPTQQESGGSSVGGNWFQREGSARVLFSNEEMIVAVCRVFLPALHMSVAVCEGVAHHQKSAKLLLQRSNKQQQGK